MQTNNPPPLLQSEICQQIALHNTDLSHSISLVASENRMSPAARHAGASDLAHRYTIPPEEERPADICDYPGQTLQRTIAHQTCEQAKKLFHAAYADVRPLSGNNAVFAVLKSLTNPGDTVMRVPPDCGGHFATRPIADLLDLTLIDIPYDTRLGNVDIDATTKTYQKHNPALILFDASMLLFAPPLQALRDCVGPEATISYDGSHTLGLIAGNQFCSPLTEGANLLHGSTHKTLFGPQKGMILCRDNDSIAERIYKTVVPTFASNIHSHHVAALGVALEELTVFGHDYAATVVERAKQLASALDQCGITVSGKARGFTQSHQIWIELGSREEAILAFRTLEGIGIYVNAIKIPFSQAYGLRVGLAESTRRGIQPDQITHLGNIIADAILKNKPIANLHRQVREIAETMNKIHYGFPAPNTPSPLSDRL